MNKNRVAEKAVQELEEEFLRQEPGGEQVTSTGLAIATARLNSRLRVTKASPLVNYGPNVTSSLVINSQFLTIKPS